MQVKIENNSPLTDIKMDYLWALAPKWSMMLESKDTSEDMVLLLIVNKQRHADRLEMSGREERKKTKNNITFYFLTIGRFNLSTKLASSYSRLCCSPTRLMLGTNVDCL